MIVALTSLGIDPLTDGDFMKNGHTVFDAMLNYRLEDGSFEHAHGKGSNHTATVQAFYSSVALYRFLSGQPGLYLLSAGENAEPDTASAPATEPVTQAAATTKKAAGPDSSTKPASTTAAQNAVTAAPTTTAATTAGETSTAAVTTTAGDPDEAIIVIRPENKATLPEFASYEKTASAIPTDAGKQGGAGYYIGGAVGIAAVIAAVAVVLVKKKKR